MRRRTRSPIIRLLQFLIKTAGIVTAAAFVFICISFFFRIKKLEIEPGGHYTEKEISDLFIKSRLDKISYLLYCKNLLFGQGDIPFIQKIDISVVNRNTVKIKVYDKVVSGCVDFMGSYLYFDKDGMIVESFQEQIYGIPVVSGLVFDKIVLYETLKVQKSDLFQTILEITNTIKLYELPVNEIAFQKDDSIVLYCDGHIIELGRQEYYGEQLNSLKDILKSLQNGKYFINMAYSDTEGGYSAVLLELKNF